MEIEYYDDGNIKSIIRYKDPETILFEGHYLEYDDKKNPKNEIF